MPCESAKTRPGSAKGRMRSNCSAIAVIGHPARVRFVSSFKNMFLQWVCSCFPYFRVSSVSIMKYSLEQRVFIYDICPPLWARRQHARLSRSGPGFDPRSGQVSWVRFFRCFSSPVRQMSGSFRPQGPRISFGHHYFHHRSLRAPMTWDVDAPYNVKYMYIHTTNFWNTNLDELKYPARNWNYFAERTAASCWTCLQEMCSLPDSTRTSFRKWIVNSVVHIIMEY